MLEKFHVSLENWILAILQVLLWQDFYFQNILIYLIRNRYILYMAYTYVSVKDIFWTRIVYNNRICSVDVSVVMIFKFNLATIYIYSSVYIYIPSRSASAQNARWVLVDKNTFFTFSVYTYLLWFDFLFWFYPVNNSGIAL